MQLPPNLLPINRASRAAVVAMALFTISPASAQWGGVDGTFTPTTNDAITSAVAQSDGSVLIAGNFTQIKDWAANSFQTRYRIARLSSGGVLDANYRPNVNAGAFNIVVQPDDSAYFCGAFNVANFASASPTSRVRIAKFRKNGIVDTGFATQSTNLSSITSMAVNTAGNVIISCDAGLYSFKPDGQLEVSSAFKSYTGSGVASAAIQLNQKILMSGEFVFAGTNGSGVNTFYQERLSQNGGPDSPAFSPVFGNGTYCSAVQADGKILVGGRFSTPRVGFVRLRADGVLEPEFQSPVNNLPFLDGAVRAIAIQADGKILAGGDFINVRNAAQSIERRGIARFNPDGSLDSTFNANIVGSNFRVFSISLQGDGKILIAGEFQKFGGTDRPLIARLINYGATQTLTTNGNAVTWLRGGSAPEAQSVILEWRPEASPDWQLLENGIASRTAGGWTRTLAAPLPHKSFVRASARTTGGLFNGSSGIVSATYFYQGPKIGVSREPGGAIANGGAADLGNTLASTPQDFPFTISNTGDGALSGFSISFTGPDAGLFSVQTPPAAPVAPAGSTPLVIRMSPNATPGTKTATLNIASNDSDTPLFSIALSSRVLSPIEAFRLQYFGVTTGTGDAADDADPDGDGQDNLFEFIAGLVPNDRASLFTQRVDVSTGKAKVIFSPRLASRTYEVETSTTLAAGSWSPAAGTTADDLLERTFTDAAALESKRLYRVKITRP